MAALPKLDAVNIVLGAGTGESPVSTLSSGLGDAELAERVLDEVDRDVQAIGFHCNTEFSVTLTRDSVTNTISVPANTLSVDPAEDTEFEDLNITQRGGTLYDLDNHTNVFTQNIQVDIVYKLDFEDLPYHIAYYIAQRAARTYQQRNLGSQVLDAAETREEQAARERMEEKEEQLDDYNVLRDSRSVALVSYRKNRYVGR
jgi:hypothetical protein